MKRYFSIFAQFMVFFSNLEDSCFKKDVATVFPDQQIKYN